MTLGNSVFMFAGCFVNYSTYHNSSNSFSSFFPQGRVTFGEVQLLFVLFILFLRLALSLRTTPKGTGAFLRIEEPSVLTVLLNIRLPIIIVIPKGTGAFEIEDCVCKLFYLAYLF